MEIGKVLDNAYMPRLSSVISDFDFSGVVRRAFCAWSALALRLLLSRRALDKCVGVI